ncbi:hypothetical protein E6B08_20725 [Pseudomonas putida]|uniref:RING-type E3 ubiquitin transferase n=1 Tax=Pseudomonas putida TaxID=303 RepID=A0A4D6XFK0_PSEPU|nr:NEL-type E3 ubiquitin ligase domain-containing protein [Pseudomonas putida]QCI13620.1 hypothetical protein E6B08_20725 [Pseudomonas putida]
MTNNRLTTIPAGIVHLGELRHLTLMANRIRMTSSNREVLLSLSRLHSLNLSHNPLHSLDLRFETAPLLRALRLNFCGLTSVPQGLELCQHLDFADLSDNSITELPAPLMQMPWVFRARINFNRNALSARTREDFYGVDRHGVTLRPRRPASQFMDRWVEGEPPATHLARSQLWARLRAREGSAGLFDVLQALTDASDFTQATDYVRSQVWSLLEALSQDEALQQQIFASAVEPRGCVDSVAERFSRLQIEVLVYKAEKRSAEAGARAQLLDLGRRLFRLEQVDQYAFGVIRQRQRDGLHVDDLEVVLGYRIRLADALSLPCQPRSMRFAPLAAITAQDERDALAAVRAAETSEAVAQSVVRRDFWIAYLRAQHAEAFADIDASFEARGTQLDEQVESLGSQDYRQRWDELASEREAARHDLALQLTRETLAQGQGASGQTAHRD